MPTPHHSHTRSVRGLTGEIVADRRAMRRDDMSRDRRRKRPEPTLWMLPPRRDDTPPGGASAMAVPPIWGDLQAGAA